MVNRAEAKPTVPLVPRRAPGVPLHVARRATGGGGRRRPASGPLGLLLAWWVAATPSSSAPALAYERATVDGEQGIYLYWARRTIRYQVHEDGCADVALPEAVGAIKRAFFTWASPSCTDLYFDFEGLTPDRETNLVRLETGSDGDNRVVWREAAWPPEGVDAGAVPDGVAALTTISYNTETGEIVDADIDLNGFDNFWTTTDDETQAATDIQNVLTHEIGHLLGLAHVDDQQATMYGETPQAELEKRSLTSDDLAGLCTIYPFDEPTPVGPDQPPPHAGVQGASTGCSLAPSGSGAPWPLPLLLPALLLVRRRASGPAGTGGLSLPPCCRSTRRSTTPSSPGSTPSAPTGSRCRPSVWPRACRAG